MGIFAKAEYQEIMLPFIVDFNQDDMECGGISLEAYGIIEGTMKYCYASYILKDSKMYENGDYEQIIEVLKNFHEPIKILLKYKKDKLKDFMIDIDQLSSACNDARIKELELVGWGLNDKSFKEI